VLLSLSPSRDAATVALRLKSRQNEKQTEAIFSFPLPPTIIFMPPLRAADPRTVALLKALQSREAREFILNKYKGAVVPAAE
jgi:hypothetical protein